MLSHLTPDRSINVDVASRMLSKAETNYSRIEKEGLAITFVVKEFHQFIHRRHVTVQTDHKPLLGLLAENKPIRVMTSARMGNNFIWI